MSLINWLMDRLRAAVSRRCLPAMRVGLLDTGELVLVDGLGRAEVFTARTTGLIRNTLVHTDSDALDLRVGGTS